MSSHREALLDVLPASAALLRREARGDSYHRMTGSLSLIREDSENCAPTGVVNALGQVMVSHHPSDMQVFNADTTIAFSIALGGLEVKVAALAADF